MRTAQASRPAALRRRATRLRPSLRRPRDPAVPRPASASACARRAATSASSGGRSSSDVSPKRSMKLHARGVQDGAAGRLRATLLVDEAPVQQAAYDVAGVHAPDALDDAAGHRLPVGDDGQRLQRGRREPHGVRAEVARDERATLGSGAEHDLLARDDETDAALTKLHLQVTQSLVHLCSGEACHVAAARRRLRGARERVRRGARSSMSATLAAPRLSGSRSPCSAAPPGVDPVCLAGVRGPPPCRPAPPLPWAQDPRAPAAAPASRRAPRAGQTTGPRASPARRPSSRPFDRARAWPGT